MADEKQLQDNQNQVGDLIARLRALAGPRGATYAGRVLTEKDTPESVMQRLPGGDIEEFGAMAGPLAGAGMAGITKAQLKAGVRPPPIRFFDAPKGVEPSLPIHKMPAAVKNLKTGEIISTGTRDISSINSGYAYHDNLRKLIPEGTQVEEGFVDPNTLFYYSRSMLDQIEKAFSQFLSRGRHAGF